MSQVQIVAAYENYEQILAAYSADLKKFLSEMEELVSESEDIIGMLGSSWKGNAYNEFAKESRQGFSEIRTSLSTVGDLSGTIDQTVPKIHALIQQLKGEI